MEPATHRVLSRSRAIGSPTSGRVGVALGAAIGVSLPEGGLAVRSLSRRPLTGLRAADSPTTNPLNDFQWLISRELTFKVYFGS